MHKLKVPYILYWIRTFKIIHFVPIVSRLFHNINPADRLFNCSSTVPHGRLYNMPMLSIEQTLVDIDLIG